MSRSNRYAVVAAGFVLAAAAVLAITPAASAHDSLVEANPADGEVLTAPISEVSMRFSGILLGVDTGGNVAVLTGPDGAYYETGCAAIDGTNLTLPVVLGEAGTYQVDWRVVSSDGHPISGEYQFEYQPPAGTDIVAGAAVSACAGVGAAPESAVEPSGTPDGVLWGVGIGAAALLVVAAAVVLILRRPSAAGSDSSGEDTEPLLDGADPR